MSIIIRIHLRTLVYCDSNFFDFDCVRYSNPGLMADPFFLVKQEVQVTTISLSGLKFSNIITVQLS